MSSLLAVLLGLVALALGRPAHQRLLLRRALPPRHNRLLWTAGAVALGLGAWLAVRDDGWVLGLLRWCGAVSAATLPIVFGLPYLARGLYSSRR